MQYASLRQLTKEAAQGNSSALISIKENLKEADQCWLLENSPPWNNAVADIIIALCHDYPHAETIFNHLLKHYSDEVHRVLPYAFTEYNSGQKITMLLKLLKNNTQINWQYTVKRGDFKGLQLLSLFLRVGSLSIFYDSYRDLLTQLLQNKTIDWHGVVEGNNDFQGATPFFWLTRLLWITNPLIVPYLDRIVAADPSCWNKPANITFQNPGILKVTVLLAHPVEPIDQSLKSAGEPVTVRNITPLFWLSIGLSDYNESYLRYVSYLDSIQVLDWLKPMSSDNEQLDNVTPFYEWMINTKALLNHYQSSIDRIGHIVSVLHAIMNRIHARKNHYFIDQHLPFEKLGLASSFLIGLNRFYYDIKHIESYSNITFLDVQRRLNQLITDANCLGNRGQGFGWILINDLIAEFAPIKNVHLWRLAYPSIVIEALATPNTDINSLWIDNAAADVGDLDLDVDDVDSSSDSGSDASLLSHDSEINVESKARVVVFENGLPNVLSEWFEIINQRFSIDYILDWAYINHIMASKWIMLWFSDDNIDWRAQLAKINTMDEHARDLALLAIKKCQVLCRRWALIDNKQNKADALKHYNIAELDLYDYGVKLIENNRSEIIPGMVQFYQAIHNVRRMHTWQQWVGADRRADVHFGVANYLFNIATNPSTSVTRPSKRNYQKPSYETIDGVAIQPHEELQLYQSIQHGLYRLRSQQIVNAIAWGLPEDNPEGSIGLTPRKPPLILNLYTLSKMRIPVNDVLHAAQMLNEPVSNSDDSLAYQEAQSKLDALEFHLSTLSLK